MGKKLTLMVFGLLLVFMGASYLLNVDKTWSNPYHNQSANENTLQTRFQKLTIDQVKARLAANPKVKLVDVRSQEEFGADHIEGAINIPVDEIDATAPGIVKRDDEVIFYCHDGPMGETAANALANLGYGNLSNMEGGINKWRSLGYPVVK